METEKTKKKLLFLINPISGGRRKDDINKIINENIKHDLFNVEIITTDYEGHARELSHKAVKNGIDIIVAVGGDGTINEVASQMINTKCIFGIIPQGSGNGLARHLGIPRSIKKSISLLNTQKITQIDTARVNEHPFISIAGIGFDAKVANLFSNSKKRGFINYLRLITENYFKYKPKKYRLLIDSKIKVNTRALFISFANSNQFGYNTSISPHAKLNDGKLDVCVVQKPNIFEMPIIINLLLLKKIHLSPHVNIIPAKNIEVTQSKNRVVNIDGEAVKLGNKLNIEVNPLSLNIIIP